MKYLKKTEPNLKNNFLPQCSSRAFYTSVLTCRSLGCGHFGLDSPVHTHDNY